MDEKFSKNMRIGTIGEFKPDGLDEIKTIYEENVKIGANGEFKPEGLNSL